METEVNGRPRGKWWAVLAFAALGWLLALLLLVATRAQSQELSIEEQLVRNVKLLTDWRRTVGSGFGRLPSDAS